MCERNMMNPAPYIKSCVVSKDDVLSLRNGGKEAEKMVWMSKSGAAMATTAATVPTPLSFHWCAMAISIEQVDLHSKEHDTHRGDYHKLSCHSFFCVFFATDFTEAVTAGVADTATKQE